MARRDAGWPPAGRESPTRAGRFVRAWSWLHPEKLPQPVFVAHRRAVDTIIHFPIAAPKFASSAAIFMLELLKPPPYPIQMAAFVFEHDRQCLLYRRVNVRSTGMQGEVLINAL